MDYYDFLKTKVELAKDSGFGVEAEKINKALKPHQKDAVMWALKGGRRALFESFGLGKTIQEIEFCHQVIEKFGGKALIVLPLGVRQEFTHDATEVLGYDKPRYVTTMGEVEAIENSEIVITNYERVRDGDIDPKFFKATSLDEASVLRSFGSKTYQTFLDKFKGVDYKLVATATPSPNKYKELIHYAGYLEVMDTGQALTRFFQRDSTKANNLTLYPSQEDEFWLWISSWALFVSKPSDLSDKYSDDGYVLPQLQVNWHEIPVEYGKAQDRDGQMCLFNEAAAGLKEAASVKKESIAERCQKAKEIIDASPDDHFVIWHDRNAERDELKKLMPEIVDIDGSMDYDLREKRVLDFSYGKTRLFATKKAISGSGCNFQRYCHREIFVGIDYEFNDFIQAIHRCYRFLQTQQVIIDIWRSSGDRLISKDELENINIDNLQAVYRKYSRENIYNYEEHVKLAKSLDDNGKLPAVFMVVAPGSWNTLEVWDDINRMRTLNTTQARRRLQMHVCPLQLDIVERIINRYSNKGDLVLDPFGGLMTVPMTAVKMGRKGYGIELNPDYFRDGVGYLQSAETEIDSPTLFDFLGVANA